MPSVVTVCHIQPSTQKYLTGGSFPQKGGGTSWDGVIVLEVGLCNPDAPFGTEGSTPLVSGKAVSSTHSLRITLN